MKSIKIKLIFILKICFLTTGQLIVLSNSDIYSQDNNDGYHFKISQGISYLLSNNIIISNEDGPAAKVTINYTSMEVGRKFGKNEIGISFGKNSAESPKYFIVRVIRSESFFDTVYNLGSQYITENYLGLYYSRDIFLKTRIGMRISFFNRTDDSKFLSEYFIVQNFPFDKKINISTGLSFSAKNENIFDFKNYKSKMIIFKIGIDLKL